MQYAVGDDPIGSSWSYEAAAHRGQIVAQDQTGHHLTQSHNPHYGRGRWRRATCLGAVDGERYPAIPCQASRSRAVDSLGKTLARHRCTLMAGEVSLTYLPPVRGFCQSEPVSGFHLAGISRALEGGRKVAAIRDWVASEISYVTCQFEPETDCWSIRFSSLQSVCSRLCAFLLCACTGCENSRALCLGLRARVDPQDFSRCREVLAMMAVAHRRRHRHGIGRGSGADC